MDTPATTRLRRNLHRVAIGMAVLACTNSWWLDRPGGTVTHAVIAVASRICPGVRAGLPARPSVADGAHAVDQAVLRRVLDALGSGQRRCRRGAGA